MCIANINKRIEDKKLILQDGYIKDSIQAIYLIVFKDVEDTSIPKKI